jgi:ADP-ribose pyrophosphatase
MISTLERRLVYENDYVRVFDDRVAFPDGHEGTYYHCRWKAPYGVALVPVAAGRVLLVNTFRYGQNAYSLEIPRGFGVEGRAPRDQALIELREETGLAAAALEPLFALGDDYLTHVFIARLAEDAAPSPAGQERTEDISGFEWITVGEIDPVVLAGRGIREPMTMAALLAARALL